MNKKKMTLIIGAVLLVALGVFFLRNVGAGKSEKRPVSVMSGADLLHWLGDGGAALTAKEAAGTYYFKLSANITLGEAALIDNGHSVVIDLNGHTIQGKKQAQDRLFAVTEGASLTLLDGTVCSPGADANGGIVLVEGDGCALHLENVTLTNTDDTQIAEGTSGGVIYVKSTDMENPAQVTLKGNSVINGSTSGLRNSGGSICAAGTAQIRMYGGTIQDGQAGTGGNVQLTERAALYLYEGTVQNGRALGKSATVGMGGNVNMKAKARFYICGGMVSGGDASRNGGNVFVSNYGTDSEEEGLHLYGGSLVGGTSVSGGGNIFATDPDSVIRIYGGSVVDGKSNMGGNIYLEAAQLIMRGGTLTGAGNNMTNLYGGNVFNSRGRITMYDGVIEKAMTVNSGGNVFLEDGTMELYGGVISNGRSAAMDVNVGGGNLYATGDSVINMYNGTITRGISNYDKYKDSSAAGGNVMIAGNTFMQMFGGTISDGMIYGKISRGGNVYVYGQTKKSNAVFQMYGGEILAGETQGTMRGMAIAAYGESKTAADTAGRGTARIFGGTVKFTGPYNSSSKVYSLYTNRMDMECLRVFTDLALAGKQSNAVTGPCPDSTHETKVEYLQPTCVTSGYTHYRCNTCGDWYQVTENPLGHGRMEGQAVEIAGQPGWYRFSCEHCGVWYSKDAVYYIEPTEEEQYQVAEPLAYPDYTFSQTPDTTQLRQTAVQAMRDLLSVQWCSPNGLGYYKNGSKKFFDYPEKMTFGGVMYSGAGSGLFQFLEFYDYETGRFQHPGTADRVKNEVGSACTDSLLWSWSTVCNSFNCGYFPSTMVQSNGFLLVGEYRYDKSVKSFYALSTEKIVEDNGQQVMARSYAQMLPADILVSSTDIHGMMVIEAPQVVHNADGTVNTEESFVMIQDQRGGIGADFYEVYHEGYTVHHSGRISEKYTFAQLLEKNYIPVTTAEFAGVKSYEPAEVTVQGGAATTVQQLQQLTVNSNYPIAVINIYAMEEAGNKTLLDKVLFNGLSEKGVPRSYAFGDNQVLQSLDAAPYSQITVEVVSSTGERFTPITVTLN